MKANEVVEYLNEAMDVYTTLFRLRRKKMLYEDHAEWKRKRQLAKVQGAIQRKEKLRLLEPYIAHLRELRERENITQRELAGRMRTGQTVISRFELGLSSPTTSFLRRYVQAIGCELLIAIRSKKSTDTTKQPS